MMRDILFICFFGYIIFESFQGCAEKISTNKAKACFEQTKDVKCWGLKDEKNN